MLKTCLRRVWEPGQPYGEFYVGLRALQQHDHTLEHWLRTEVVETDDRVKAGTERMIPIEEVIAEFGARRKERDASQ